ncbi:MAG: LPS export ABC transporter permease LptG [Rhodobacteraceae bacterium]|nr:LPS export ABC transporter permease LptG [Paracoccaceae bacterium]
MILHAYFARKFLLNFLALFAIMFGLVFVIDVIDQTRKFSSFDISFREVLGLTILNIPESLNEVLPLIIIFSTVSLFVGLARSSELVVTRASGRSAMRAVIAPAVMAFLIGCIAVMMLGPLVAATSKRYAVVAENYRSGGASALAVSVDGLWLRQGDETGQAVIRATRSNTDASVLFDVSFYMFDPEGSPIRRIEAENARLTQDGWQLDMAKSWPLERGQNPEVNAETFESLTVSTTLTLDRIRENLGRPSFVSIWDMRDYIDQLEVSGFSSRAHRVWLISEFARPLFLMSMVLVAAAFTMRHTRFGGTGIAVLAAVLLGFSLYFIRSFAHILGENGQLPILLAAWAPPMAALFLATGLLLSAEDG